MLVAQPLKGELMQAAGCGLAVVPTLQLPMWTTSLLGLDF
jgi:hypothetical protein